MILLTTVARGEDSRITDPRRVVVRSAEEWTALWAAHAGPGNAAPPIDFSSSIVAAVFAGERLSAGYGVEVAGAVEEGAGVRVFVEERRPGSGMVAAQILTAPYHIVSMPRVEGELVWTSGSLRRTVPPPRVAPHASGLPPRTSDLRPRTSDLDPRASTTGLKPTTAAALAYFAGPVSGATILFAETRNQFVRFHAWQAILGIGGAGLMVIVFYVLAFGSLFVSATGVATLVRVATALWLALVVLWGICIWQAWSGRMWKLPLAGDAASRLAINSQHHNSQGPN